MKPYSRATTCCASANVRRWSVGDFVGRRADGNARHCIRRAAAVRLGEIFGLLPQVGKLVRSGSLCRDMASSLSSLASAAQAKGDRFELCLATRRDRPFPRTGGTPKLPLGDTIEADECTPQIAAVAQLEGRDTAF